MVWRWSDCSFVCHRTPRDRTIDRWGSFWIKSVLNENIDIVCKYLHIHGTCCGSSDDSTSRTIQRVIRCPHECSSRRRWYIPDISCLRKSIHPSPDCYHLFCESKVIISEFCEVDRSFSKGKSSVFSRDIDSILIIMLTLGEILILTDSFEMCIKFVLHYSYSVRSGSTSWIGAVVREPIFFIICAFSVAARFL